MKIETTIDLLDGRPTRTKAGHVVPRKITARLLFERDHTVELDIEVEGGEPICTRIEVHRRPGLPSLSGDELRRLPVATWVAFVLGQEAMIAEAYDGGVALKPATEDEQAQVIASLRHPRRSRAEETERAARVFRDAKAMGRNPAQEVAAELHVSVPTAYRRINDARNLGLLPKEGSK